MIGTMKKICLTLGLIPALFSFVRAQAVKDIVLSSGGHYIVAEPKGAVTGVLVLAAGFGQRAEDTFPETKLPQAAYAHHILTVSFAAGNKLYADSTVVAALGAVLRDVTARYKVGPDRFVLGGFSAGGMIVLRYAELCNQFPERFPIRPRGVFLVDSPIDIFTIWNSLEENYNNKYSLPAVEEAAFAMQHIKNDYGIPGENIPVYSELTAFSMNKAYGTNEQYLKQTAVRAYHDVDIAWRLNQRNQTVHNANYEVTAELINRLMLTGNTRAEFVQTFRTGYRANGQRHPHSWSIVDEKECITWARGLLDTP